MCRTDLLEFLLVLDAEWQNRKILVAARFASIRRNRQASPYKGKRAFHVFGSDSLQIRIPTDRTVRAQGVTQRNCSRIKASFTHRASPRINCEDAQYVVYDTLPARTTRLLAFTHGTGHLVREPLGLAQDRSNSTARQDPLARSRLVQW
jgi:hypothetical protein